MDDDSARSPEGVQCRGRVIWWRIHVQAERPKRVGTVHQDITQADRLRGARKMDAALGGGAESIRQLGDRHVTQALRRLAHCSVGSKSTSKEVSRQGHVRRLGVLHEVGEHVAHPPPLTPGRGAPRRLVERFNLVGEPPTQTGDLPSYIRGLHDSEHCKRPDELRRSSCPLPPVLGC
jgi:hypothetical protein